MIITEWMAAFFVYLILDIAWAKYTQALARDKVIEACSWAAILPVLSAVLVLQYLNNPWLLIPMAAGGAVGTFIAMTLKLDKTEKE